MRSTEAKQWSPTATRAHKVKLGVIRIDYEGIKSPGEVDDDVSFPYEVAYKTVPGLTFEAVKKAGVGGSRTLRPDFCPVVRQNFIDTIVKADAEDCACFVGNCGFMHWLQDLARQYTKKPVALSPLMQLPMILESVGPYRTVLVCTANGGDLALMEKLIEVSVGVNTSQLTFVGCEDVDGFEAVANGGKVDVELVTPGILHKVRDAVLKSEACSRAVGAILMECTQLPPFSDAVRREMGLPVFDALTNGDFLLSGFMQAPSEVDSEDTRTSSKGVDRRPKVGVMELEGSPEMYLGSMDSSKNLPNTCNITECVLTGLKMDDLVNWEQTSDSRLAFVIKSIRMLEMEHKVQFITGFVAPLPGLTNFLQSIVKVPIFTSPLVQLGAVLATLGSGKVVIMLEDPTELGMTRLHIQRLGGGERCVVMDMSRVLMVMEEEQKKGIPIYVLNSVQRMKNMVAAHPEYQEFRAILLMGRKLVLMSDFLRSIMSMPVFTMLTAFGFFLSGAADEAHFKRGSMSSMGSTGSCASQASIFEMQPDDNVPERRRRISLVSALSREIGELEAIGGREGNLGSRLLRAVLRRVPALGRTKFIRSS